MDENKTKSQHATANKDISDMSYLAIIQDFINVLPYYVFIVDEDHNIIIANDTLLTEIGKNQENISGHSCPKLIHGTSELFPGCPLDESIAKGRYIEKDLLDPFHQKWVSSAIYPLKYTTQDGKKLYLHTARDITHRKMVEEKIQEQNIYLMNILDSLTHPFYIIDANEYTLKMANSVANFGTLSENSKCYKLTHKKNKPCNTTNHPCPIEEIKKSKKSLVVEHVHYDKDGNSKLYEVHGYPIFDTDGEVSQIIEYTLDITERKKNEENLKNTRKALELKSKNLEDEKIALNVLLDHQSEKKKNIEREITTNFETLVHPYIEKLKNASLAEERIILLNILEKNLSEIFKPFTSNLTKKVINLSPAEVRTAKMVKEGRTAKEIAEIMHISENTVKEHNSHIRKKLGIKGKKINLKSFLQSIFDE